MTERAVARVVASHDGLARRARIVEAAVDVFAELGFGGASLREVAAAAGMEKGHLAYYFPTKDDLLFEIVDDLHQRFLAGMDEWSAAADGARSRLHDVLRGHVALVCRLYRETRVAYESMGWLSAERRAVVTEKRARYEAEVAALIEACRDEGGLDGHTPTDLATKAILGMLNWAYYWYDPDGRYSAEAISSILADRALASLRP